MIRPLALLCTGLLAGAFGYTQFSVVPTFDAVPLAVHLPFRVELMSMNSIVMQSLMALGFVTSLWYTLTLPKQPSSPPAPTGRTRLAAVIAAAPPTSRTRLAAVIAAAARTNRARLAAAAAPALVAASFLITRFGNVPINQEIRGWSPSDPPSGYADRLDRWELFHDLRTATAVAAFLILLLVTEHQTRSRTPQAAPPATSPHPTDRPM
ncbi:DUF1772 domain-containing protein [Actinoplanes sp. NPDC024001]|uniref:DUF1772 domain-containing protein n=1 Tax=Actinoplanes sp. NPDC024001 TaxID=3154598 RepID=UPI0033D947C2